MNRILVTLLFWTLLILGGCQKEKTTIGTQVSETFYLENKGASMGVLVQGNTASHIFLLFVHGGPGTSSLFYNGDYISQNLEDKYALVYLDQRNAGSSQGNFNAGDLSLGQMTEDLGKAIRVIKIRYGAGSEVFLLGHSFGGLLTTAFLSVKSNESMVNGWIFVDGSHNYPLNDSLTRDMLIQVGNTNIAQKQNPAKWEKMVD